MKKEPVMIDTKILYEVLPDLPTRKCYSTCKMCNKEMHVLGELTTIMWNDYLDGGGGTVDLCGSCAGFIIKNMGGKNEER